MADLILNVFGEAAARRYRALAWMLWLGLVALIGLIIYACLAGPLSWTGPAQGECRSVKVVPPPAP